MYLLCVCFVFDFACVVYVLYVCCVCIDDVLGLAVHLMCIWFVFYLFDLACGVLLLSSGAYYLLCCCCVLDVFFVYVLCRCFDLCCVWCALA